MKNIKEKYFYMFVYHHIKICRYFRYCLNERKGKMDSLSNIPTFKMYHVKSRTMKNQSNISNTFLIFKQDLILLKTLSVLLSHCELY